MGLDMYLEARRHLGNYSFSKPEEKALNKEIKTILGLDSDFSEDGTSVSVNVNVAYWRKANQVHKWFVDNCQNGVDNCGRYWVDRNKLEKLLDLCTEVLENKDANLLPPTSGFFFGSTDVDDWYWDQINYTKTQLNRILTDETFNEYEFEYLSSW